MTSDSSHPLCWWCGGIADSREHRVKASELRKMFIDSDHLFLGGGDRRPAKLKGPGAKAILFPKVMCRECNNTRSKPFDNAYDHFVQKIRDDPEYFRSRQQLDMTEIFNGDSFGSKKLARYYMKNIACRIAEIGFDVPAQIVDFMNGAPIMPNATLVIYKDFSNFDQFKRTGSSGHYPCANRMHNPDSPDNGPLVAFCAEVQDGPVGAIFWWDSATELGINFGFQRVIPLRERRNLPYHGLHEDEWDRAAKLKLALDLQLLSSTDSDA
ncbi:hypothetical protein [Rhodococcus sp. NPDC127528]|uniref:hypothetical protein n=1 Tax=unclassified Rhodococcus (in: high G+C Gram-positive bacteria) TaxID=192944 RepID=UPI0036325C13